MTGILVKRRGDTETQTRGEKAGHQRGVRLQAKGRQRLGQTLEAGERPGAGSPAASEGTSPAHTWTADVRPPERGDEILLCKRLSLWRFVTAALEADTPHLGQV